jgi:hypothetical protein
MAELTTLGWLQGLAEVGCVFMELNPDTKRSRRAWCRYSDQVGQKGVRSALEWLRKGSGVGILPKPPLWILDADSVNQVRRIEGMLLDAGIIPLKVSTPSGGAHFYFLLPASFPIDGLMNHLVHPNDEDGCKMDADFKFGPRTLLVAPGTIRNGKRYEPASDWRTPPVVDPRMFLPGGKFWREHRPFLVDTRPWKDRVARACRYLASKAPVSVSGKSGRKTLIGVTAHLVRFLGLDPVLAFTLLTHGKPSWNMRCTYPDGRPYPWDKGALWNACMSAVDAVPAAGVKAYVRDQANRKVKKRLTALVEELKASITGPGSVRVPVAVVRDLFEWNGLPDLTPIALGDELAAQGINRLLATGARTRCVPGLDFGLMQVRILEAEHARQVHAGWTTGCPLLDGRLRP